MVEQPQPTKQQTALAGFIAKLLAGTADVGFAMMPLIAMFKEARQDPSWKERGVAQWLKEDPRALEVLAGALNRAKTHIPDDVRCGLILALGGTP